MIAVTYSSWKAKFLDAKQSLGFDLPDDDVVWCPGHYASLILFGEHRPLALAMGVSEIRVVSL